MDDLLKLRQQIADMQKQTDQLQRQNRTAVSAHVRLPEAQAALEKACA